MLISGDLMRLEPLGGGLLNLAPENIVLYGPPGSGKTTLGRAVAEALGRRFFDTDEAVERLSGKTISELFAEDGEIAHRRLEAEICQHLAEPAGLVVSCGGGALLDERNRLHIEAGGTIFCLQAEPEILIQRLKDSSLRPLLAGEDPSGRLLALLDARRSLYESFPLQLDTGHSRPAALADRIVEVATGLELRRLRAQFPHPGYDVFLGQGILERVGELLGNANLGEPLALVSDSVVGPLYGEELSKRIGAPLLTIPAGEAFKRLDTVSDVYDALLAHGMERGGTLIALGGGVVIDLTGFAAATFMRGIRWVAMPTTLLAMVDASVGGKVAIDLPQGKNLVGAFHPPALVVSDIETLESLPELELRSGLAEIVKAALIADPELLRWMEVGPGRLNRRWIERALNVKLGVVDVDPHENGKRAVLNLGHTLGHALETASNYRIRHGEAVAIGLVGEAHVAEALDMAEPGLKDRIESVLTGFGLPTRVQDVEPDKILEAMERDKKRAGQRIRFALPMRPGHVEWGVEVPHQIIRDALDATRSSK